jgi:alpha-galactosidase
MRAGFARLERFDFQSTSDQQDVLKYLPIAVGAPIQMLPEQARNWAYPQPSMTDEEIAFAMVTVSGFVDGVSAAQLELVADGPELFKNIRSHIAASVPHWPTGLPDWNAFIHLAAAAQSEGDNPVRLATQRRRRVTEAGPRRERRLARRAIPETACPVDRVRRDNHAIILQPAVADPTARVFEIVEPVESA